MVGTNFFTKRTNPSGDDEYVALTNEAGDVMFAKGATVPTDGDSGYGVGCMFCDTTGSGVGTTFYINEGTNTVCDFNASAGGASTTLAALTDTAITSATEANVLIYDGTNSWDNKAISGDIAITKAGAVSIAAGVIINADVKSDAAIAWSKMASSDDISTSGTVTDLTMTGVSDGDVIRYDVATTSWVSVDPTTLPGGTASTIAQSATIEAGTYDITLTTTSQTVGANVLTIPDFADVNDTFTFNTLAATLLNKTLDDATCKFGDTADATKDLFFSLGGATTAKTMTIISSHTDDRSLTLPDATDTLAGKATTDTFTNKILSDDTCGFGDAADVTKYLEVELAGATTGKTMTIVSSQTDDRSVTLPDATDTLVGKATTDTLTNKTMDCDGTGNALSNVNADETDPYAGTNGAYGIPLIITGVNGGSADITVIASTAFKMRILDAWSSSSKASNSGTWKLTDGTNDITATVSYGTGDTDVSRVDALDDAHNDLASSGELHLINSESTDTSVVHILAVRVD